jgi:hypothetical protein
MKKGICSRLRVIAMIIHKATATPEQVIRILNIFEDLLSNDSNFIDLEEWGTIKDGKKVFPFSFSKKGMSQLETLKNKYPEFEKVYRSGVADIKDEHYTLTYFLTQFLIVLPMFAETLEFRKPKNENEKQILENLKEKYKEIDSRRSAIRDLQTLPFDKISERNYEIIKKKILNLIRRVEEDYKDINLTEKEKEFVLRH